MLGRLILDEIEGGEGVSCGIAREGVGICIYKIQVDCNLLDYFLSLVFRGRVKKVILGPTLTKLLLGAFLLRGSSPGVSDSRPRYS